MNTQDYINELKIHLYKLNDDDREDAISYYFEYLAEAGPEGAANAMEKLGSPAELAAGIRADQAMQDFEDIEKPGGAAVGKGVQAVWLAGIAAVPRTALAVFVTAIMIVVFFTVMVVLFAAAIAVVGGGALGVGSGLWLLHLDIPTAVFYLGCGLALIGGGIFVFRFALWCSKHLLIAIADVFNGIRHKREKKLNRERAEMLDRRNRYKRDRKREKKDYKIERKLMRRQHKAERKLGKAERRRDRAERKREKAGLKLERRLEKRANQERMAQEAYAAQIAAAGPVEALGTEAAAEAYEVQEPVEALGTEAAAEAVEATEPATEEAVEAAEQTIEEAAEAAEQIIEEETEKDSKEDQES
ncbi:MAG: DUF1700 domain-containing protein [Clostridiales bacterium]|nr:DUF1700 domain-containing protein [Clostridiales bacterium]